MKSKFLQRLWLLALLMTPIVLWILPADFFDNSKLVLCPSRFFFDVECFGCGMTRAVMHMHHFEFTEAVYYNFGVVLIYPALAILWFIWSVGAAWQLDILNTGNAHQLSFLIPKKKKTAEK
jgi:hypothetical protein